MIHSHPRFPPDCLPKLERDGKKQKGMRQNKTNSLFYLFSIKQTGNGAPYTTLKKLKKL